MVHIYMLVNSTVTGWEKTLEAALWSSFEQCFQDFYMRSTRRKMAEKP